MNARGVGFLVAVLALVLVGCGDSGGPAILRAYRRPLTTTTLPPASCHGGALPDPVCTPGPLNPAVTQTTIRSTICVRGWTSTVRPPLSYTAPLKLRLMAAYGYAGKSPTLYELDHFVPLELGGAPSDPGNLWPEARAGTTGAGAKDAIENLLKARVCAGKVTLAAAQAEIKNWQAVR